jgi:hypothetical protein
MALTVWPTFAAQDGSPRVTPIHNTVVQAAQGGPTFKIDLWPSGGKTRYTFSYNGVQSDATINAPGEDYNGMTELAALRYVFAAVKGRWGRINVVDPITGAQVLCELESDELEIEQDEGAPWWAAEVSFLSVIT